jgi:hypothetical protein
MIWLGDECPPIPAAASRPPTDQGSETVDTPVPAEPEPAAAGAREDSQPPDSGIQRTPIHRGCARYMQLVCNYLIVCLCFFWNAHRHLGPLLCGELLYFLFLRYGCVGSCLTLGHGLFHSWSDAQMMF